MERPMLRIFTVLRGCAVVSLVALAQLGAPLQAAAQDKDQAAGTDKSDKAPQQKIRPDAASRITIEVTGGTNEAPIDNASVYLKYVEEHAIKRDKKLELNVKTSREGIAHVPNAPMGRALVQVIAEGWKTFGRWYDITETKQLIKIHLERPPKWY
jgi:hypothetical protein